VAPELDRPGRPPELPPVLRGARETVDLVKDFEIVFEIMFGVQTSDLHNVELPHPAMRSQVLSDG
jgi:hypothetical protein